MHYILGHVKWFTEDMASSVAPGLSASEWLVAFLSLTIGVGFLLLTDKLLIKPNKALDDRFERLRNWVPTAVRLSTALLLISNYWSGYLYAPNIELDFSSLSSFLSACLVVVAILLLFGIYTRIAGSILLTVYLLSLLAINAPIELLDHLEYIGIGLFLVFSATGELSVSKKLVDPLSSVVEKFEHLAPSSLKIFSGLTLIVLAFSEKLINMSLANDFLINNSSWNFLSSFGLNNRNFIIFAGIVMVLLGLSLVLNKVPRLSTLVLLVTMIVTTSLLGPMEITGHLFAIGLTFAVWVGPNKNIQLRKRRL